MRTARGRIIPTGWPAPHGADPGRSMKARYDVAVIGGGIVGMATALALVEADGRSLVVLEAEDTIAAHQSGHNSGVIHSGLYYKPGSLKAQTCREGREALSSSVSRSGCRTDGVASWWSGRGPTGHRPWESSSGADGATGP